VTVVYMYIACTYRMAVHGVVMDFPWTDHGSLDNQVDEAIVHNSAAVASIKAALKTFFIVLVIVF